MNNPTMVGFCLQLLPWETVSDKIPQLIVLISCSSRKRPLCQFESAVNIFGHGWISQFRCLKAYKGKVHHTCKVPVHKHQTRFSSRESKVDQDNMPLRSSFVFSLFPAKVCPWSPEANPAPHQTGKTDEINLVQNLIILKYDLQMKNTHQTSSQATTGPSSTTTSSFQEVEA